MARPVFFDPSGRRRRNARLWALGALALVMLLSLARVQGNHVSYRGGAASILCGIAANLSIAEGGWVKTGEVLHGLDRARTP